jgi:hypothetical protein
VPFVFKYQRPFHLIVSLRVSPGSIGLRLAGPF